MPFISHADWTLIEDGEIWYSAGSKVCSSSISGPERSMSKTRIILLPTPINPKADGSGTHSWTFVGVLVSICSKLDNKAPEKGLN